jgi:hypothetical protein
MARPSTLGGVASSLPGRLVEAWLADDAVRSSLGVNTWEGIEYLDREKLDALLRLVTAIETATDGAQAAAEATTSRIRGAAETAGYRVERLRDSLVPGRSGWSRGDGRR